MLKSMVNLFGKTSNIEIIMRDDVIISITLTRLMTYKDAKNKQVVHRVRFYDSLSILNAKLEKLAVSFGVKGKMDFPYPKLNDISPGGWVKNNKDYILEYNLDDCIILYQIIERFSIQM